MSNSLACLIDGFVPVCCFVSLRVFHTNTLELRSRTLAVSDSQSVNTFCNLPTPSLSSSGNEVRQSPEK